MWHFHALLRIMIERVPWVVTTETSYSRLLDLVRGCYGVLHSKVSGMGVGDGERTAGDTIRSKCDGTGGR